MIPETYIIGLLQKYLENKCNEQELRTLLQWLKSTDDYSCIDVVDDFLRKELDHSVSYPTNSHVEELREEVSELFKKINSRSQTFVVAKRKKSRYIWGFAAAAAVALVFVLYGLTRHSTEKTDQPSALAFTIIQTTKGERKECVLADGTKLTVNSESKVVIPDSYNKGSRQVHINGEVFFDVKHDASQPFTVISNGTSIKDIGTAFNVRSYAEDATMSVTVTTGKVRVNIQPEDMFMTLSRNERLEYNKENGSMSKSLLTENNYTKWTCGVLYFNDTPIRDVVKIINRAYNRKVILQANDPNMKISGKHDNKSLEAVIEAICFTTGLRSRVAGNAIILY
jgi:transmembrane sensor